jgi:hypothetical protein
MKSQCRTQQAESLKLSPDLYWYFLLCATNALSDFLHGASVESDGVHKGKESRELNAEMSWAE